MKTLSQHIQQIKARPHHIRRRVAFTSAAVVTGLVALIWLVGSVSSGIFALKNTSFADGAAANGGIQNTTDGTAAQGLAGAAAAADDAKGPAQIRIVNVNATTSGTAAEQTTIPF
jgi:glycerol-3-phosphate acyltransferase PlsY